MSKMSELSQALDDLIACGEKLATTARAIREMFSEARAPDEPAAQPKENPTGKTYTFAEVRKAFSAKSHAGYTDQIKALIASYGADKLSAVKEEDYGRLMADLEGIG